MEAAGSSEYCSNKVNERNLIINFLSMDLLFLNVISNVIIQYGNFSMKNLTAVK